VVPDRKRILDVGEDALVTAVITRYGALPEHVLIGPGDDAAVLDIPGQVVASTDTLVEGYDFRRDWSSARDVGIKTAAQNLADIAAMGARPLALLVSLAAPGDLPSRWATELAEGLDDECRRAGAAVVGGDVSQATEIVITGSALGVLSGRPVLRSGARPGDGVALAGTTGPSGAGLALLTAGVATGDDAMLAELVRAHLAPRPPYPAGVAARIAGAHAMIDTSDGLLRDAGRIAASSAVSIDLDPVALTPGDALRHAAAVLHAGHAGMDWVLSGGEDHALLACFPPGTALPPPFRPVGRVLPVDLDHDHDPHTQVLVEGRPWTGVTGWTHFSR
jgi:thiamine-monophosphate kinase